VEGGSDFVSDKYDYAPKMFSVTLGFMITVISLIVTQCIAVAAIVWIHKSNKYLDASSVRGGTFATVVEEKDSRMIPFLRVTDYLDPEVGRRDAVIAHVEFAWDRRSMEVDAFGISIPILTGYEVKSTIRRIGPSSRDVSMGAVWKSLSEYYSQTYFTDKNLPLVIPIPVVERLRAKGDPLPVNTGVALPLRFTPQAWIAGFALVCSLCLIVLIAFQLSRLRRL
jgi:hypothetical protein